MARRRKRKNNLEVDDFRHEEATRKNNPPAGLAPTYEVHERKTTQYQYDPHLDPQLVWAGKEEYMPSDIILFSILTDPKVSAQYVASSPSPFSPASTSGWL